MHILLAHNDYARFSGEEAAVESLAGVLQSRGHDVSWLRRYSAEIGDSTLNRFNAFFSGIYSFTSKKEIIELLSKRNFDLVQVQNLYPLISASILPVCKKAGTPVVMRCPNYRLFCPTGLHLRQGQVCELCLGGRREWNCIVHNCAGDVFKSIGYAARNAIARLTGMIVDNVTVFVVLSEFQKHRFVHAGIAADRIEILPNSARPTASVEMRESGDSVTFIGRVSEEKGVRDFLEAARSLPGLRFRVAGSTAAMPKIKEEASSNVEFVGFLSGEVLDDFYRRSRILVFPSRCFEGFPNTIVEAMARGKPVIGARIGALPEIVEDGATGLLVNPGDPADLASKIDYLWQRPSTCREMGQAGLEKVRQAYSVERYYDRLIDIYAKATRLSP